MRLRNPFRLFGWTLLGFLGAFASAAYAAAVLQSAQGDVRAGIGSTTPQPVAENARLLTGMRVTTGAGAQATLRFDDGQQVVLNQNTEFRITDYRYSESAPESDRSVFDILRGALRVVTGLMGQRNAAAFQLRAPQMTIGIRGTDFMVAVVNPGFVGVLAGAIGVTTVPGTVGFGAGAYGSVASTSVLAVSVPASALPTAVASAFSSLSRVTLSAGTTAGGVASGAEPSAAPAEAGVTPGTVAFVGATAAAVAAAVGNNPATTHHAP